MKNKIYKLKYLIENLESKKLNVCHAAALINSVISSLMKIRTHSYNMDNLIESVKITAL